MKKAIFRFFDYIFNRIGYSRNCTITHTGINRSPHRFFYHQGVEMIEWHVDEYSTSCEMVRSLPPQVLKIEDDKIYGDLAYSYMLFKELIADQVDLANKRNSTELTLDSCTLNWIRSRSNHSLEGRTLSELKELRDMDIANEITNLGS